MSEMDVDKAIEELGERWGYVEVAYHPTHDEPVTVRNKTDEGLGAEGDWLRVESESLVEALHLALDGKVETREW